MRFKSVLLMAGMILVMAAVAAFGCGNDKEAKSQMSMAANTNTAAFAVTGMHCGNCASHVKEALTKVEGVQNVIVSYEASRALVEYNPDQVTPEELLTSAQTTGFTVVREITDETKLSSEKSCDMSKCDMSKAGACPHMNGQMTSGDAKSCGSAKKNKKGST